MKKVSHFFEYKNPNINIIKESQKNENLKYNKNNNINFVFCNNENISLKKQPINLLNQKLGKKNIIQKNIDIKIINILNKEKIKNIMRYKIVNATVEKNKKFYKNNNRIIFFHIYNFIIINMLFQYLILITKFYPVLSYSIKGELFSIRKLTASSEVKIKLISNGTQKIVNSKFKCPDEIYIDDILIGNGVCSINIEDENKQIKLKWNDNLKTCNKMFSGLDNIKEIDLSNFDTSLITNMVDMFNNCKNLESINLKYLNTSLVQNMTNMFYCCKTLKSLDLSDFNTSLVTSMNSMFSGCNSLNEIDISSFNTSLVTDMFRMFGACNLTSLEISNFDTSLVERMDSMFSGCNYLTSINLLNFNTLSVTSMNNMFSSCNSLTSLDISNFDTSSVTSMGRMFSGCNSLTSLDLKNFETSLVEDMSSMFNGCNLIKSLDLSNFDTSSVTDMSSMFMKCNSLKSINLSSFNTLQVTSMNKMFSDCQSLKSIDISKFNVSSVLTMESMFSSCTSLKSIDLSNFDDSLVTNLDHMFFNCIKLTSINISNFDTSNVNRMSFMFLGCKSLLSLDLSSLNTSSVKYVNSLFENCNSLTSINLSNFDTSKSENMSRMFSECFSLSSIDISSFETSNAKFMYCMFYNCSSLKSLDLSNFKTSKSSSMYQMFYNCTNLQFINFSNYEDSTASIVEIFDLTSNNLVVCLKETNTDSLKSKLSNKGCYNIDCREDWKKKKKKIIDINNTCIETCEGDSIYEYENRCYKECPIGTIPNNSVCEIDENQKKICKAKDFFLNICSSNAHNIEDKKEFAENIVNEITEGKINDILLEIATDNEYIVIKEENEIYQISTLSNQYYPENNNLTYIDFGECEILLKRINNIDEKKELIKFQIDHFIEGFNIPIIEYMIFTEDGKKLNLDICNNSTIIYNIPVSINDSEQFKYDPKSDYYNDKCYPYTTDSDTDITIFDRKKEYNDKNMSLCEINCTFRGYNYIKKRVECECNIKSYSFYFFEINFDQDKLLDKFYNFKSLINFGVLACFDLLFSKKGLYNNFGSYILLSIIFLTIIESILTCTKGYTLLVNRIKKIIIVNCARNVIISDNSIKKKKPKKKKRMDKIITSVFFPPKKKKNVAFKKASKEIYNTSNDIKIYSSNNYISDKKNY